MAWRVVLFPPSGGTGGKGCTFPFFALIAILGLLLFFVLGRESQPHVGAPAMTPTSQPAP
jgi:hypothetical protein